MCGICGRSEDPQLAAVRAMCAAMAHRGPDDESVYKDESTGMALGARRLSIIDVEGGRQPVRNEDGTIWAVLNGEIYNHRPLRDSLRAAGHEFTTGTDTEVLVHLYERYGASMVHALEGMFAFAVWDGRQRRLLIARDRFGEKPLFYQIRDGVLTFASELTALVAGAHDLGEVDPQSLDAYFVHGYVPGPATMLLGARQLPAAHTLEWDVATSRARVERYWSPSPAGVGFEEGVDDLVDELHRLLDKSLRGRLISDVPLGVLLSGGVDSSLIAALTARATGRDGGVEAFTVGYDVGGSEIEPARHTAQTLGLPHRVLTLTRDDIAERVPRVLAALDQPLADQALVPLQALSELASESVKVLVGGEGADELFGGYPRYRWLARADGISRRVPAPVGRSLASAMNGLEGRARGRRLVDVVRPQDTIARHVDWVTDRRPGRRAAIYGPRLADFVHDRGFGLGMRRSVDGAGGDTGPGAMMRLDQEFWLCDDVLAKADRAGMLASVELRTPFLHREVAEFAASVPVEVHLSGRGKPLLRTLLKRVAPELHHRRSKAAFRAPADEWLRGPLASLVERQLEGGLLYREGWFSATRMRALFHRHRAGPGSQAGVLWAALTLGVWLDGFRARQAAN